MKGNLQKAMKNISVSSLASGKYWVIPLAAWILLASVSLIWNLYALRKNTLETFISEAQTLAGVALSTIQWTAHHERVYVPLTEWVPMEPSFAELPEMEVVTTCGLRLTRLSHDVIIRQVAEQAHFHGWGRKSLRITSLRPLNPVNAPDEWERETLKLFENGQTERFALIRDGPDALLKYMVPMRATATSMQYPQGYMVGDLLGGLSVRERAASRFAMIRPQIISIAATHAVIFAIVATAMLFLLSRLRRQWLNLDQLNSEQRKMIARLAESEAKLEEMAVTDELTGLKNRRGFFMLAEQQLKAANREKTKLWFIFIDVDGMKSVNDQYGHSEGDKALAAAANILRNTFRESDVIARIGGDEFVVMITGADESKDCVIMDRLQKNLDLHNAAAKDHYRLSLSAGIVYSDPGEKSCSIEALLKKADALMYEIKRGKTHCRNNRNTGTSLLEPS
jgi:diguanylate cyclase (GGDEF)-like protein